MYVHNCFDETFACGKKPGRRFLFELFYMEEERKSFYDFEKVGQNVGQIVGQKVGQRGV
jgi:hypothetical protein